MLHKHTIICKLRLYAICHIHSWNEQHIIYLKQTEPCLKGNTLHKFMFFYLHHFTKSLDEKKEKETPNIYIDFLK